MQVAESNNLQHCWCCKLLDSATCIPKQVVGFRLTYLYYVDLLIRITLVLGIWTEYSLSTTSTPVTSMVKVLPENDTSLAEF